MTRDRLAKLRALAAHSPGQKSAAITELADEVEELWKAKATRDPLCNVEMPFALHNLGAPFESAWKDFVADRRERRKPVTSRAARIILDRLSEKPARAVEALRLAIENRWTSFRWEWVDRDQKKKAVPVKDPDGWQEFLSTSKTTYRGDFRHAPEWLRLEFSRARKKR